MLPSPARSPLHTLQDAVEAQSLADQAYAHIKQLIFDFALLPGERFSETELSQRVNVSRTPLRQALQRLAHEGFVHVMPKIGWQITAIDFDQFDELYDLRILIECHAVAVLTQMESRPILQTLADVWLIPAEQRVTERDQVRALDEAFHQCLVQAIGNQAMLRVHQDIAERIRIIRRLDFIKPYRIDATYDEHARILRAITKRRTDEAVRLLKSHIEQSKLEVRHITLDMLYQAAKQAPAAPSAKSVSIGSA